MEQRYTIEYVLHDKSAVQCSAVVQLQQNESTTTRAKKEQKDQPRRSMLQAKGRSETIRWKERGGRGRYPFLFILVRYPPTHHQL